VKLFHSMTDVDSIQIAIALFICISCYFILLIDSSPPHYKYKSYSVMLILFCFLTILFLIFCFSFINLQLYAYYFILVFLIRIFHLITFELTHLFYLYTPFFVQILVDLLDLLHDSFQLVTHLIV
jgi:hypothetical protein